MLETLLHNIHLQPEGIDLTRVTAGVSVIARGSNNIANGIVRSVVPFVNQIFNRYPERDYVLL